MIVKHKSWVQPSEAAVYFGVDASVIRHWINEGKLRAAHLPTGHLRILARDVVKSLLEQGKSIPSELDSLSNKHVLIVDPDRALANSVAHILRENGGCNVTVAESSEGAMGLLNGTRPDLVLLGVRHPPSKNGNGALNMLILAGTVDEPPRDGAPASEMAFRVDDILPAPVDELTIVARVASVLLG
jgi:excisionase family DNA binding protein